MAKPQLRKPKKKIGPVKAIRVGTIDYKDTATLRKFISDRGDAGGPAHQGADVGRQGPVELIGGTAPLHRASLRHGVLALPVCS